MGDPVWGIWRPVARSTRSPTLPATGWYDDLSGTHRYRWWDGASWTGHVAWTVAYATTSAVVVGTWAAVCQAQPPFRVGVAER